MKTRILVLEQHSYLGGGQRVLKMVFDSLRDKIDPLVALAFRLARHVFRIVACSQAAADSLLRSRPALAPKLSVLCPPVDELRPGETRRLRTGNPLG